MSHFLPLIFCLLLCVPFRCVPPEAIDLTQTTYSLTDPEVVRILDWQDRREKDSLALALTEPKAYKRLLAARALGVCKDSNHLEAIIRLLEDPVEQVKQEAIFALGLIGHPAAENALIKTFNGVDSSGEFNKTNGLILEALGRCGSDSTLNLICEIKSYNHQHPDYVQGQVLALYRYGLRGKFCPQSTAKLIEIATNKSYDQKSRLWAAHSLMRFKEHDTKPFFNAHKEACYEEKDPDIRLCLIHAFARIGTAAALSELEELYRRGLDHRVQLSIVRGLQFFPGGKASSLASKALLNPSTQVAVQAAQYFVENGQEFQEDYLTGVINQGGVSWQVKALLYEALLKIVPAYKVLTRSGLIQQIKNHMVKSKNPYEKSAYIKALSSEYKEIDWLISNNQSASSDVVHTALTESVMYMVKKAVFPVIFKGPKNPIYQKISKYLIQSCEKKRLGSISAISTAFANNELVYLKTFFKADSIFAETQNALILPKDIETFNDLSRALAKLKKIPADIKKPNFNHPINWEKLKNYKDTIAIEITTDKGPMECELYPLIAPGSVCNMIELIETDYFVNKIIHRVVPNFVIQTGCPIGDGYGSMDYSIRTEIHPELRYDVPGRIGMASAGMDTESCQFFITYTATPHLDGNYSIFGQLTKGMDVLASILVGDQIKSIKILDRSKITKEEI
ncbi:MAG: peptidylprolyl isomerase [Saprospiraceae bacterium]|nr:peptidylprolyl isomerase [Saprospiraceae bacterium]